MPFRSEEIKRVCRLVDKELLRHGSDILMRAHDHVWEDQGWSKAERLAACNLLFELAMEAAHAESRVPR